MTLKFSFSVRLFLPLIILILASSAMADNYLGFHWARTQNPFVLQVGNNVDRSWAPMLNDAVLNWSKSDMLNEVIVPGLTNPTQCAITSGRIEVCSASYGKTGWYGLTGYAVSNGYIVGAYVKLNSTYKMSKEYRTMIACHELGHTLGLAHQDETFSNTNLGTCLDYTNDPSTNQQPNSLDYKTLFDVYSILDSVLTVGVNTTPQLAQLDVKSPKKWGKLVHATKDQKEFVFERNFGGGNYFYTHVTRTGEDLNEESPEQ